MATLVLYSYYTEELDEQQFVGFGLDSCYGGGGEETA